MNTVKVENCKTLFIGRRGENEVTEVVFDFSEWQTEFGNGVIDLFVKRNGDSAAYPVVLSVDGTVATWLVTATDTNVADYGKAEYVYTVNGKIAKSAVFTFYVAEDIGQASGEAPDPYEDWIETLTGLGTETQLNAQAAEQSANDAAESAASAATSADQSEDSAEDAEAWAIGERNGEPVTEGDPTYNNNAKFWAGKAMTDAPVTSVNGKAGDIVLNLDDIPNGVQYARTTPAQVQQIGDNAADIADIEELIPTEASANNQLADKNYVDSRDQTNTDAIAAINAKIPPQASASNQLADKILVNTKLMAYRTAADQDAIDSAQDGKINALTNLLNSKQSKITANGILKGNGNGGVSAAVAGMDYLPTSALYAYRSANAQDAIDNAQNENINKNTAALNTMQPAATAADIGKALIVKTVADGKPTSYEYGEAGGGGSSLTAGDGIDIANDVISNTQGIEYIVGTQTAATSKWTGNSTDEELKVGKIIAYYLPYAGATTAATLALTMADGTTTREISLQLKPGFSVTTNFPAGSIIILVYDGTYWRVNASYDTDTNTYTTGYCVTNGAVAAKTASCTFGYRGDANYFPCLFRYANTAADATLAITTYAPEAAPIYVNGARTSATNTFSAGVILFLYYNGAYYCYNDGRFPILVDGTVTSVQEYAAGLLADYRTAADQDTIDAGKQAKITATGILKGDGSGGVSSAVAGTDYATPQQVNEKYAKPSGGIPSTDMTAAVQASLSKAESALQAVPDTYRTAADQDVIDNEQDDRLDAVEQSTTATTIGPVALATFDASAANMPLNGLTVNVEPIQAGSGDPSPDNVRPISGWTTCKLHRTGVSLIGGDAFIGNTFSKTANGYQLSYNGSSISNRASAFADIMGLPAGRYTIEMLNPSYPAGVEVNIRRNTAGSTVTMGVIINAVSVTGRRTYNIPENTTSLQLYIIPDTTSLNTSITMSDIVLVREGDASEPYKGNVYNITFPSEAGAVYGGTLDVVNRKLNSYPYYSSYNGETLVGPWVSSMDVYTPGATPTLGAQVVDMGGAATSYDLSDVPEITTFLGENNIWANRGDVTVTYGAYLETVKAYADKVGDSILSAIAPLEMNYTASRSYAAGSFLFVGTKFYKVTAAISSGDTINPGTNVTQTTVAEQLMALAANA